MTVTKADLNHLAAQLRLAGELLERDGETAWITTLGWEAGPAAANTEAGGGNRVDDDDIPISISDPTGDAAVDATCLVVVHSAHDELKDLLDDLASGSGRLVDVLRMATPHMPKPDRKHLEEARLIADGWCVSCHRDSGHLQPIDVKKDGSPYYRGLCKWCGEFRKTHRIDPPVELLNLRHSGRRLTVPMVQRALARKRKKKSRR